MNYQLHFVSAILLAFCTSVSAIDLTPAQQELLAAAEAATAKVQTNLQEARETSAGHISPAKAKLAFSRIDMTRQSIEQARARLIELPADNPEVQSLHKQLVDAAKALEDLEAHLTGRKQDKPQQPDAPKESIIAANELPPDRYKAPDRDQLVKIATEAWLKIQPEAKVLAVRIPSLDWNREVQGPDKADSNQKTDRSKLQMQLIVAHDDKLAVIHPIDLWKNHLEKDAITAAPLHDKTSKLSAQDFLLLTKIK